MLLVPRSIGHPPHSLASPVELRLWVGPRAVSPLINLETQHYGRSARIG